MKKIRNQDIASALNISTAAVSMARNYKPGVSEETRNRVFEYIRTQEEILQKEEPGLSLTGSGKKTIIVSVHKKNSSIIVEKPFFSDLMEAIEQEAASRGYNIQIKYCNGDTDAERFVAAINAERVSGVIILATELLEEDFTFYNKINCKCVLLDAYFDGFNKWDSVTIDNFNATYSAFEYAYNCGHRKFGYIRCTIPSQNFEHRYEGYMKGLRKKGLADKSDTIFSLRSNVLDAYIDMNNILDNLPEDFQMPTCFLVDLDYMAIGAVKAFEEHGFRVPDDISIIGFDDINFGDMYGMQLTTIHLHQKTMGRTAVQLLTDRAFADKPCSLHIEVSADLIERGSVRRLVV